MKLGFFVTNQYLPNQSMPQMIKESVEQVRLANQAGFDLICTGQHYMASPYQMSSSLPLLARLAAESGSMEIAATVILIPLHNPVELAESIATMDSICDGKFIFGIGLGYRDEEYMAFGVQKSERVGRLTESMEIMKLLWTKKEVEFQGKYFHVPHIFPATHPVQKPYPPIWVAANNPVAIKRAARWGYPWLINPHATVEMVATQLDDYKSTLQESGHTLPPALPMMRELYITEDSQRALQESEPFLGPKYEAYAAWGQDKVLPGEESFNIPYKDLAKDRFLLGSPEQIVEEIQKYQNRLGVDYLIFRMQWPGMLQKEVLRQIQLLGDKVIPNVK